MNADLKKLIAREGVLFIAVAGIAMAFSQQIGLKTFMIDNRIARHHPGDMVADFMDAEKVIVYLTFIAYLMIRFIIWAIKTLKGK